MRTIMEMRDAKKNIESELLKTIEYFEKEFKVEIDSIYLVHTEKVVSNSVCVGVKIRISI